MRSHEDFVDGLRVSLVYGEFLQMSRAKVFSTMGYWCSTTEDKCHADFHEVVATLAQKGCGHVHRAVHALPGASA